MKRIVIIAFSILSLCSLGAQNIYTGAGTAVEDGLYGPLVNPASVGTGKTGGLGFSTDYTLDSGLDNWKLFLNTGLVSGVLTTTDSEIYGNMIWGLGFDSLSFGADFSWNLSTSEYLGWKGGALYRPLPYVSMSYQYDSNNRSIGGLAVRPFAFNKDNEELLTLAADALFTGTEYDSLKLYATSVPVDGIEVSAGYDTASENWFGDISFRLDFIEAGTTGNFTKDGTFTGGEAYTYISGSAFESVLSSPWEHNVEYTLPPAISEAPSVDTYGFLSFQSPDRPIYEITAELDRIAENPGIKAVIFRKPFSDMSLTQLDELVQALLRCRDAGKKIIFYSEFYTLKDYILAAATADQVYMYPVGQLAFSGITFGKLYWGDFLKNNNVVVTDLKSHPYKTANNTWVENEMTPEEREALQLVLDREYDYILELVKARRGDRIKNDILEVIAGEPFMIAESALENGLVDELIYEDQFEDKIAEITGEYPLYPYFEYNKRDTGWAQPVIPRAAVIFAIGGIHSGPGQDGQSIGSETTAAAIRAAREDSNISAIIIRVDSGGGSALASDVIAREVQLCKEAGKPVVVTMASVAASGGYYIAAPADHIIAYPSTITGSIGVTSALFSIGDFLKEHGINYDVVKKSGKADLGSIFRNPTDEEVELLMQNISYTYDTFINTVAAGREMSYDDVHAVAQGRIWTGVDALEAGLIDELGGWKNAIEWVEEKVGADEISLVDFTDAGWGLPSDFAPELSVEDQLFAEMKAYLMQAQLIHKDGQILLELPYHFQD